MTKLRHQVPSDQRCTSTSTARMRKAPCSTQPIASGAAASKPPSTIIQDFRLRTCSDGARPRLSISARLREQRRSIASLSPRLLIERQQPRPDLRYALHARDVADTLQRRSPLRDSRECALAVHALDLQRLRPALLVPGHVSHAASGQRTSAAHQATVAARPIHASDSLIQAAVRLRRADASPPLITVPTRSERDLAAEPRSEERLLRAADVWRPRPSVLLR